MVTLNCFLLLRSLVFITFEISTGLHALQVTETPWCDDGLSPETNLLSSTLAKYNALGILTINSQPNVNGVSSTHPIYGWGDKGGYIFQKVGYVSSFL